jgi:hypothetical protein
MRGALGAEDNPAAVENFYLELLAIPIKSRSAYLLRIGFRLPEDKRSGFMKTYSAANATLTRKAV